jgi:hypothetical protein
MKSLRNSIIVGLLVVGIAALAGAETATRGFQGEELLPPNPKAGECYARVHVPATYKTVQETVLKKQASERLEVIPARYEWVQETVMVKGPSERLEIVPAKYGWVDETVLVRQESTRIEQLPPVYETVTERVVDMPAHTVWKKGTGPIQRLDFHTGEIMCLVEIPATYKTVTRRVLAQSATTREVLIAAEYDTVRRREMTEPPSVRKIEIPAEYTSVKVRKLVSSAQTRAIPIPAEYQTVTRREKVTEGGMDWRRIMCETNITSDVVMSIQRALQSAGHNPGRIDGVIGAETASAIRAYQKTKGLPVGHLTYETLERLGVKLTAPASS